MTEVTKAPEKGKKRLSYQELFTSPEEAVAAAESRTKGPRRAFKCTYKDKTFYVVHNNDGRAGGVAFSQIGGAVEELGGRTRKAKPVTLDGIMAALNSMPEVERKAAIEQLRALSAKK